MERRDFIRLSAAGAAISAIAPSLAQAAETGKQPTPPGDVFYTKDAQGRWAGKAATHLPVIEVVKADDKTTVKITTPHEMKGYEHYIVKHVLLDKDYKFLNERMFDPSKDPVAISEFSLAGYSGTVYALSLCNKHDLWLNSAEV
ncbi:desulfoferrodoxin family protein [Methylomonas sp. YC3]